MDELVYDVSSYLAKILSPVVGNTVNTVKNSLEFADFIRGKTLDAEDELVSFDVVSLFTKIPVDLAIEIAKKDSERMFLWKREHPCLWTFL